MAGDEAVVKAASRLGDGYTKVRSKKSSSGVDALRLRRGFWRTFAPAAASPHPTLGVGGACNWATSLGRLQGRIGALGQQVGRRAQ
jgi:hypothetical protein